MKEYKEHFVAFLDILGFKELLKESTCDEIYPIFDVLHTKSKATLKLNGTQIEAYNYIHHMILSDSIVLYIDASIKDAFASLIDVCSRLQTSLANRDNPILLRGGIVKGKLFCESDIIYGEGLTRAYLLESKLAKYPRIIFTGDTLEEGKENTYYMFTEIDGISRSYHKDKDGLYFVDYMLHHLRLDAKEPISYYSGLLKLCETYLNKEIDFSMREKYLWLKEEVNQAIQIDSSARAYFEKLHEEESERKSKEYNERFSIYKNRLIGKISIAVDNDKPDADSKS